MQNKLSLWSLDTNNDLRMFSGLIHSEMMWLFSKQLPKEILFIPHAFDGEYYNSYIQSVKEVFASFGVGVILITDGDPVALLKASKGIVIGGGGSLEKLMEGIEHYSNELKMALSGKKPYLGWNEGAVLPSPYYIVPSLLATGPKCLGATLYQLYPEYVDSDPNRFEIKNFLLNHLGDATAIKKVKCLSSQPGGGGVRLEDDVIALDFAGGSPAIPNPLFTLNASGQLVIR
jgi:hypothetical protein